MCRKKSPCVTVLYMNMCKAEQGYFHIANQGMCSHTHLLSSYVKYTHTHLCAYTHTHTHTHTHSPVNDVAKKMLDSSSFWWLAASKAQLRHSSHQEPAHLPLILPQQLNCFSEKKGCLDGHHLTDLTYLGYQTSLLTMPLITQSLF